MPSSFFRIPINSESEVMEKFFIWLDSRCKQLKLGDYGISAPKLHDVILFRIYLETISSDFHSFGATVRISSQEWRTFGLDFGIEDQSRKKVSLFSVNKIVMLIKII